MPDGTIPATPSLAEVAVVAVGTAAAAAAASADSEEEVVVRDISGTYEIDDIDYRDLPLADRRLFFGADPDIEFELTQKGDKFKGEFSDDRDGTIKGKIDDEEVTFEFLLEARGGEYKEGSGTWIVQDDGSLKGDFSIRDRKKGIIRGLWVLTKTD